MKKTIFFALVVCAMALPGVFAIDTSINVISLPNYDIDVLVLAPTETYDLIYTYTSKTDGNGVLSFVYKNDLEEFKVSVKLRKGSEVEMYEQFGIYEAGEPMYLRVLPGNVSGNYLEELKKALETQASVPSETVTETPVETSIETQESSQNNQITGNAVTTGGAKLPTWAYYTLASSILVVAVAFFVAKNLYMKMPPRPPNPKAFPAKPIALVENKSYDNELLDAEKKIRQAQEEIDKIKSKKMQLAEAEAKYEQAKAELDKAKQSYGSEKVSQQNKQPALK